MENININDAHPIVHEKPPCNICTVACASISYQVEAFPNPHGSGAIDYVSLDMCDGCHKMFLAQEFIFMALTHAVNHQCTPFVTVLAELFYRVHMHCMRKQN